MPTPRPSHAHRLRAPQPRSLRLGALTADLREGDLRHVRAAGEEIVRRVYFVARDPNWLNLPQRVRVRHETASRGHFLAEYAGRTVHGAARLAWTLACEVFADGVIEFRVEGIARSTFLANRVGLCVHLPLAGVAGRTHQFAAGRGRFRPLVLPAVVSPHQPATNIRRLRLRLPSGARADLEFAGDDFELEDQRNWIDGSFKVYSRPLSLPFPYRISAGDSFSQSLRIRVLPAGRRRFPPVGGPVKATLGPVLGPAPQVGIGCAPRPLTPDEVRCLAALKPAHLRLDLDDFGPGLPRRLRVAARQSAALGAPLELALSLSADARRELARLAAALRRMPVPIARFLVLSVGGPVTKAAAWRAATTTLGARHRLIALGAGTRFHLAELNRQQRALPPAPIVVFSATPQVHATDEGSMVECLEGLTHAVASARKCFPGARVAVSRLTLRPQANPAATRPSPLARSLRFDPRQSSAFCAAWTAGALGALQDGGAAFATFYELAGPGGLIGRQGLWPAGRALADYFSAAGQPARALHSSRPLEVGGWAREGCLCVANLTGEARSVTVSGLPASVRGRRTLRLAGWSRVLIRWNPSPRS